MASEKQLQEQFEKTRAFEEKAKQLKERINEFKESDVPEKT